MEMIFLRQHLQRTDLHQDRPLLMQQGAAIDVLPSRNAIFGRLKPTTMCVGLKTHPLVTQRIPLQYREAIVALRPHSKRVLRPPARPRFRQFPRQLVRLETRANALLSTQLGFLRPARLKILQQVRR